MFENFREKFTKKKHKEVIELFQNRFLMITEWRLTGRAYMSVEEVAVNYLSHNMLHDSLGLLVFPKNSVSIYE